MQESDTAISVEDKKTIWNIQKWSERVEQNLEWIFEEFGHIEIFL